MNRLRRIASASVVAVAVLIGGPNRSSAQLVVFDPTITPKTCSRLLARCSR